MICSFQNLTWSCPAFINIQTSSVCDGAIRFEAAVANASEEEIGKKYFI
jgi:hypothetical protein